MELEEKIKKDLMGIYSRYLFRISNQKERESINKDIKEYFISNYNFNVTPYIDFDNNIMILDGLLLHIRREKINKILSRNEYKR